MHINNFFKRYAAGLAALVIAFGSFAFTEIDKVSIQEDTYIWFPIPNPPNCSQYNADQYPDPSGMDKPEAFSPSENPLNCRNQTTVCCALGYLPEDVIYNDAEERWEPAPGATPAVTRNKSL
mgnify:CR=1 FL=1